MPCEGGPGVDRLSSMSATHELIAFGPVEQDARGPRSIAAPRRRRRGSTRRALCRSPQGLLDAHRRRLCLAIGRHARRCRLRHRRAATAPSALNLQASDLEDPQRDGRDLEHHLVRRRPQERRADSRRRGLRFHRPQPRSRSSARCSRSRGRSLAPSAAAITMSICSRTAPTDGCGSACTSARAASATRPHRDFWRWRPRRKWGDRVNDSMDARPATIPLGTPLADAYLAAMNVAGEYAHAGRDWVVNRVLRILGARDELPRPQPSTTSPGGKSTTARQWLVVRKGATPAFQDSSVSWEGRWVTMR